MPVQWSEDSAYMKELRKWEQPGYNPKNHPYPRMLYKAQLQPMSNKYEVAMQRDIISADKTVVLLSAEQFNATCQLTVNDEREYDQARADGWRDGQKEAMAYYEGLQQDIARAAAESNYADRNMSQAAQAERKAVEDSTSQHVAVVPEQPRVKKPATEAQKAAMARARAARAAKKTTVV